MRKLRLNLKLLKLAARFIDYEAESIPPDSRLVEYGFVLSKLMNMPKGRLLDVGCIARHNYIIPSLCFAGWRTFGIDVRSRWGFQHPNYTFVHGDIRENEFESEWFDVVVCISTLEHIGLAGCYGITEGVEDGDVHALREMRRILKKQGRLLITVPYSSNYSAKQGWRIYDADRIEKIFTEFDIVDKMVYTQLGSDWIPVENDPEDESVICLELTK